MFKLSPKMWYLLKYGFLVFISVGIILMVLPESKQHKGPDWLDEIAENISDSEIDLKLSLEILREDVTDCFINFKGRNEVKNSFRTEYSKNTHGNTSTGGLSTRDASTSLFKKMNRLSKPPSTLGRAALEVLQDKHAIFTVLTSFSNILSLLHIKAAVIEPSILNCMLLPKYQDLLSNRQFNVSAFSGSDRIVTLGIMQEDIAILQQTRNIDKFSTLNFSVRIAKAPLTAWMIKNYLTSEFKSLYTHMFFIHKLCIVHLVIFQRRSQYFWHAALDMTADKNILSKKKLLFSDYDGAYEKFLFVSLENKILPVADFYVPSNTHYFLLQMLSSRFLECNISRAVSFVSTNQSGSHPDMSVEQFNRRTRFVLRDLKKVFHPLLMRLWIWSGTMLGWHRQCSIIPYTTDVDWASDIDDLHSIINMLQNSKYTTVQQRMGFAEEALELYTDCHGLRTDIFFMYRIKNGSWCSGHSPKIGYYFRYFYPSFTLCSSELLGEKVQVPCETEDVIAAEYGQDWSKPISSWHYESSPRNRGPNIYWEKKKLKYAYQVY